MERWLSYRGLLLSRLLLFNIVCAVGMGAAYMHGWVWMVIEGDGSYISILIACLLLLGLLRAAPLALQLGTLMDQVGGGWRDYEGALKRIEDKLWSLKWLSNKLTYLGLLGTVVGFIVALSGVSPDAISDPTAIAGIIASLTYGMGIALYTTLVGAVGEVWLDVNLRMLFSAADRLRRVGRFGE